MLSGHHPTSVLYWVYMYLSIGLAILTSNIGYIDLIISTYNTDDIDDIVAIILST